MGARAHDMCDVCRSQAIDGAVTNFKAEADLRWNYCSGSCFNLMNLEVNKIETGLICHRNEDVLDA